MSFYSKLCLALIVCWTFDRSMGGLRFSSSLCHWRKLWLISIVCYEAKLLIMSTSIYWKVWQMRFTTVLNLQKHQVPCVTSDVLFHKTQISHVCKISMKGTKPSLDAACPLLASVYCTQTQFNQNQACIQTSSDIFSLKALQVNRLTVSRSLYCAFCVLTHRPIQ